MAISRQAQRILLRAAEYLKDHKHWTRDRWMSGDNYSTSERVCALGALRKAAVLEGVANREYDTSNTAWCSGAPHAYTEAEHALEKVIGVREGCIPNWNDSLAQGHSAIHAGFCKAVKDNVEPDVLD